MTADSIIAHVRNAKAFADLPATAIQILAEHASLREFSARDQVFFEGDNASTFFLLIEGSVEVELSAGTLGFVTVDTLEAGSLLGWSWLVPPFRWQFSARARAHCQALAFDGAAIRAACLADPELGFVLMQLVAQCATLRLRATRMKLIDYLV